MKQDDKTIMVKTDMFGVVTAPWDQGTSLSSDQPINIVLKDGKTLTGTLTWREGRIDVTTKETRVQVPPDQVAAMRNTAEEAAYQRLLKPGMLQIWAVAAALGGPELPGMLRR